MGEEGGTRTTKWDRQTARSHNGQTIFVRRGDRPSGGSGSKAVIFNNKADKHRERILKVARLLTFEEDGFNVGNEETK